MSRRDFMKLTGKAAASAATPQSMLKGLLATPGTVSIPKTPDEAAVALIAWAKSTGKYQEWYNKCVEYYNQTAHDYKLSTKEQIEKAAISHINDWAAWHAMDVNPDVLNVLDAVKLIVWDGRYRVADDILPEWITRYRLARWAGRDMGPNHPFVKDREKWDKLISPISRDKADEATKAEFINIIKNTIQPQHLDKAMKDLNKMWDFYKYPKSTQKFEDEGEGIQPEHEPKQPKEMPSQIPTDETDQWRTQSVEFECKLRRLVR